MNETIILPYNICFCMVGDQVLMLLRKNEPNKDLWNGVGGKLQEGETPLHSVLREVYEETGIRLTPDHVQYKGIVTWNKQQFGQERVRGGMYLYITTPLSEKYLFPERETREGRLVWQPLAQVIGETPLELISNVPHYLSHALKASGTHHYRLTYVGNKLHRVAIEPF